MAKVDGMGVKGRILVEDLECLSFHLRLAYHQLTIVQLLLEVEAASGNLDAIKVLDLRKDSKFALCTIVWGECCNQRTSHAAVGFRTGRCWGILNVRHHRLWRYPSAALFFALRLANGSETPDPYRASTRSCFFL
jgi:hypothetical protein